MPPKIKHSIECWLFAEDAGLNAPLLLLQAATTEEHPAYWQPITGGMEPGETAEQACRREVWEQTGFVLETSRLQQLDPEIDVPINAELTIRKTLFVAVTDSREVRLSEEHRGWQWVPFREAHGLLYWPSNRGTYTAIKLFLRD